MSGPYPDRRELLATSAALLGASTAVAQPKPGDKLAPRKKHAFKESINLWAFPYPEKMTLEQCLIPNCIDSLPLPGAKDLFFQALRVRAGKEST